MWQGHVPPEERRQAKEVGPGLDHQANQDQNPDRAWLPHQRRELVDTGLRRGVPQALLPDEVQFSRHPIPRGVSVERSARFWLAYGVKERCVWIAHVENHDPEGLGAAAVV